MPSAPATGRGGRSCTTSSNAYARAVDEPALGPRARLPLVPLLVAFAVLAWMVAHFDFLVDDAFITYRYARHFADGHGLVWNIGETPPVEGFSNFGWVLLCALFEKLGLDPSAWTRLAGMVSAAVLVALVARIVHARFASTAVTTWSAVFAASLPPIAVWATGGLETMTFALAVFGVFERLMLDPSKPRVLQASLWAAAAVLLRADGFVWVAIALAAVFVHWPRGRTPDLLRAVFAVAVCTLAVAGAYVAFRWLYFGELEPNTARIKVMLGSKYMLRGAAYVASLLLCVVSIPIAIAGAMRKVPVDASGLALPSLVAVFGSFAYLIVLGGDWMMMYRMLVPAMPFVALLFAVSIAGLRTDVARTVVALLCIVLSVLPAYDKHVVPQPWRERAHFRGAQEFRSEYAMWKKGVEDIDDWIERGRAVGVYTKPGESMVLGNIGAIGYYAPELAIYDTLGLTNREPFLPVDPSADEMPGHDRKIAVDAFDRLAPTYFATTLVDGKDPMANLPARWRDPHGDWAKKFELVIQPLDPALGFQPGKALILVKFRR